jgi:hypothetical protein
MGLMFIYLEVMETYILIKEVVVRQVIVRMWPEVETLQHDICGHFAE